jgi:excisionase family DNA binding protein
MAITFKRTGDKPPSALSILKANMATHPAKPRAVFKSRVNNAAGPMSEKEAAAFLGVSVYTLQRIRKRGEIEFAVVGGRNRYTHQFLENYLKSSEQPCNTSASKSVTSGFPSGPPAPKITTPQPSTGGPDKQTAAALAQTTFKKPKSFSPNS